MLRVSSIAILYISLLCIALLAVSSAVAEEPENSSSAPQWLISSGAFTNLPPGSLISVAVTLERGIQAIKLDLVLSKDEQVMVLADPRINDITNVEQVYPDRARGDGNYYSVDFTRAELKELVHSRRPPSENPSRSAAVFSPQFQISALDDILGYIDMIQPQTLHKPIIICELRKGWLHRREGKDLARSVYTLLEDFRLRSDRATLFLASYDPEELQQLAETRTPEDTDIRFLQLIGANDGTEVKTLDFGQYQPYNYELLFTKFGLKATSTYAAAIGLKPQTIFNESGAVIHADYLTDARTLGMEIILYGEAADLKLNMVPDTPASSVLDHLFTSVGFDAALTDNIDLLTSWKQGTEETTKDSDQNKTIERLIRQIERGSIEQPSSSESGTNW